MTAADGGGPDRRWRAGAAGAVALETVLVLPLVALLVTAVLSASAVLADQLAVTAAARSAARTVAVTGEPARARQQPDATTTATVTVRRGVAVVEVRRTGRVLGVAYTARAQASAPLEPAVR